MRNKNTLVKEWVEHKDMIVADPQRRNYFSLQTSGQGSGHGRDLQHGPLCSQ